MMRLNDNLLLMDRQQDGGESTVPESGGKMADELVPAVSTSDLTELAVLKSLLESAGIPFSVQGEEGLRLLPFGGGFFAPNAYAAVLHVRSEDLEAVRKLLETSDPEFPEDG